MRRRPSIKLRGYLVLTAAGTIAGLALGIPEAVALVAPFAAYVAVGLAIASPPRVGLAAGLERDRVLEGDDVVVKIHAGPLTEVHLLELELRPASQLTPGTDQRQTLRLRAGSSREVVFRLRAERWGGRRAGILSVRAHDRFGLIEYELPDMALPAVRVFPRLETVRALVDPLELQATFGSRVSRDGGEGTEFAELRPFVPGDRVRRINWRATARRGTLYVSERHPERNADVILFLDAFSDVGEGAGSTLSLAVRAAASLAAEYLAVKDRVGIIGFGGILHALEPRMGARQLYRILDALIGSQVTFSYARKDLSFVPRRLLPSKALIVAISPLVDERSIGALLDLRARGFDLAVVDVNPMAFTPQGATRTDRLAYRLWRLQREALRVRLEQLGVAVSEWSPDQPLQLPIAAVGGARRQSRHAVAA